jgi:hypothetical protein
MINIRTDECIAFDMLAIFHVKRQKNQEDPSHTNGYNWLFNDICVCIGHEKTWQIIGSEEFRRLIAVNEKLFDLVDNAKNDSVKASEVDNGVYERYLCKKQLQESFFNTKQIEKKVGYNK